MTDTTSFPEGAITMYVLVVALSYFDVLPIGTKALIGSGVVIAFVLIFFGIYRTTTEAFA